MAPTVDGESVWSPAAWLDEHGHAGVSYAPYFLANLGGVGEVHGWLWDCCPRWYVEYIPNETHEEALSILEMLEWLDAGELSSYTTGTLSAGVVVMLQQAKRLRTHLRNEAERRAIEEASK